MNKKTHKKIVVNPPDVNNNFRYGNFWLCTVYELQSLFLAKMSKISKKLDTAIYVLKYGHEHTEYAGFANLLEKQIYTKLWKLNKSRNKTYWLEGDVPAFVLLTREMILPIRKKIQN